jgi:hypothetical protein
MPDRELKKTVLIAVRLPVNVVAALRREAKAKGVSQARVVTLALRELLHVPSYEMRHERRRCEGQTRRATTPRSSTGSKVRYDRRGGAR